MPDGVVGGGAQLGVVLEIGGEQTDAVGVEAWHEHKENGRVEGRKFGQLESGKVGRARDAGHGVLGGGAERFEDQIQLVFDFGAREERFAAHHLVENATHAPHVDVSRVVGRAEEHVRWSVPQSDHFVRVRFCRYRFGTCQT